MTSFKKVCTLFLISISVIILSSTVIEAKTSVKPVKVEYVYITKTGKCYHKVNCKTLKKSKIKVKLSTVKKKYTKCKICY